VYALVGAAAAIAAAVGPLIGGFLTTFLSWRVGFLLEVVVIAVVLSGLKLVHDVPYTGPRVVDGVGALLSAAGMGGVVIGILVWQEGGEFVGVLIAVGLVALGSLARWLIRRKREGKPTLLDPDLFKHDLFRLGISAQMLQNIALGGAMIALPIYLQLVLEYNALQTGLTLAPLSLTMFGMALVAGKRAARRRPASLIRLGSGLLTVGVLLLIPIVPRAKSGRALVIPLMIAGAGLGLLVSQLNDYTLSPISDERVSEAAGVNSAAGSFGLSFGLAFAGAIMLATLSITFTQMAQDSTVLPASSQEQVAQALEDDAEVLSNSQLQKQLADQPAEIQAEIIRINTDARPLALQVAPLVPILAGVLGLLNGFRMVRRPAPHRTAQRWPLPDERPTREGPATAARPPAHAPTSRPDVNRPDHGRVRPGRGSAAGGVERFLKRALVLVAERGLDDGAGNFDLGQDLVRRHFAYEHDQRRLARLELAAEALHEIVVDPTVAHRATGRPSGGTDRHAEQRHEEEQSDQTTPTELRQRRPSRPSRADAASPCHRRDVRRRRRRRSLSGGPSRPRRR
jgi:MFS family permease